jgi:hypothetical protein
MAKRRIVAVIAIPASVNPGRIPEKRGRVIQAMAVRAKSPPTRRSAEEMGPRSFRICWRLWGEREPPAGSTRNATRVRTSQIRGRVTRVIGSPTIIHSTKPISMPNLIIQGRPLPKPLLGSWEELPKGMNRNY